MKEGDGSGKVKQRGQKVREIGRFQQILKSHIPEWIFVFFGE